ncbi:MAG: phosphodiester glycosidase family protein [Clostridium sp.]
MIKLKEILKKAKTNYKTLLIYLSFTFAFSAISAPFILLYGPFENAKKVYVGSAMATMNHQWLATAFLSQEKIDEITKTNTSSIDEVDDMTAEDGGLIEIPKRKDESIELKEITADTGKFKGYALIISDPTRIKVGVSSKLFEAGETVSQMAENYDAVAAINGGYFTDKPGDQLWTSNGAIPCGFLMSEGVIKQDMARNVRGPILAFTKEGKMLIGETTTGELLSKKENDKDTVTEAITYVHTLVKNGKPVPITKDEGSSPRTLIGQRANGQVVFVVLDSDLPGGRICASLTEARKVMMDLGCYNAVNLDGGKSTTMYFNGEVINTPSYALGERPISSGFIVK